MTEATIGHNSVTAFAAEQLKSVVERIERLEEDKKAIAEDIREVYTEAKGTGYDPKILRRLIVLRKQDPAEREAAETLLETYERALGSV